MKQTLIIFPVLVQVALTFVVMGLMGRARARSIGKRRQSLQDVSLAGPSDWTEEAQQCANSYHNQFQLPVLFYVICVLLLITAMVDVVFLILAWLFVASRLAHAAIHCSTNIVSQRFTAFVVGAGFLVAMWIVFAVRLIAAHL